MGNRAVITWSNKKNIELSNDLGIYLHWNGGVDSVMAFLTYCNLKGYRTPDQDCYGYARFCQVVGNFFGGTCSIGIDLCKNLDCDNYDNGVYVCKGWNIIGRRFINYEDNFGEYNLIDFIKDIDSRMPNHEQLNFSDFELIQKLKELNIGRV